VHNHLFPPLFFAERVCGSIEYTAGRVKTGQVTHMICTSAAPGCQNCEKHLWGACRVKKNFGGEEKSGSRQSTILSYPNFTA